MLITSHGLMCSACVRIIYSSRDGNQSSPSLRVVWEGVPTGRRDEGVGEGASCCVLRDYI